MDIKNLSGEVIFTTPGANLSRAYLNGAYLGKTTWEDVQAVFKIAASHARRFAS